MFERYTERARRVVFFARHEASAFACSSIGTDHLLLGLLREGRGVTSRIFQRSRLTHESLRREIEAGKPPREPMSTSVDIPLSPETWRTLRYAGEEAERMNASYVGTEHLLLGLLREPEGPAAVILKSKGLRLEDVREEVRLLLEAKEAPPGPGEAFQKLADFLGKLDGKRAGYHVSSFHGEAVRVEVALSEERWVATFFADGRVAVEAFSPSGSVQDEAALARLLDRL